MSHKSKIAFSLTLLLLCIVACIFRTWVISPTLSAGDLPFFYPTFLSHIPLVSAWDIRNGGMGESMLPTLWLELYTTLTMKVFSFIGWNMYVRIAWLGPYLILSLVASFLLAKRYFTNRTISFLSAFIYTCNTYSLLLVGGGQMGIALSYAVLPLGILAFEYFLEKASMLRSLIFSLAFSLVLLLDLRIAYVLVAILALRILFATLTMRKQLIAYLPLLFVSGLVITGLHMFWIIPTLLTHGSGLKQFGDIYTSAGAVQFFSFAKFENAFGLLHPNWPENIFGKVGFMKPEFLLLPILAYGSLLCIKPFDSLRLVREKQEGIYVLFFALVGLVGVFLAKGTNDPFGGIYLWLFGHIPGFIMFRDPTKWYLLIVLSYCMLIPFTVQKIYEWLRTKNKFSIFNFQFSIKSQLFNIPTIFVIGVIAYVLFLIRPAIMGQLGGTLKPHQIPNEYVTLEEFLEGQKHFSRTFWVPTLQRFAYNSYNHPAVSAYNFFNVASPSGVIDQLNNPSTEKALQEAAIQYVVVPYDSEGEIFLKDRKYNEEIYKKTVHAVQATSWLTHSASFGKVTIFEVPDVKAHFYLTGNGRISYTTISPTQYEVHVNEIASGERLVFAERFDRYWTAHISGHDPQETSKIQSVPYGKQLNSFVLPKKGTYTLDIYYQPQQWVTIGLWVSGATLIAITIYFLGYLFYAKKSSL